MVVVGRDVITDVGYAELLRLGLALLQALLDRLLDRLLLLLLKIRLLSVSMRMNTTRA